MVRNPKGFSIRIGNAIAERWFAIQKDLQSEYGIHRTTLGSVKKSKKEKLIHRFVLQVVDPDIIQSVFLQNWITF